MPRGSQPGERRGGRKKGTSNKRSVQMQEARAEMGSGMTPLQFLTKTFRNPKLDMGMRVDAAKAAAAYVHPKLSSVALAGANDDGSFTFNVNLSGADARA